LDRASRSGLPCGGGGALGSGCFAWFDFGVEWRDGPYALTWVDSYGSMSLSYQTEPRSYATLVGPEVFSVGSDQRYVVAEQHPDGNKSMTNYFIIDKASHPDWRDLNKTILGPLGEETFAAKRAELKLPVFSKTIDSLR
jgi:hypothetical protein